MFPRDPYANPIDYEIQQEKAATLARTTEKLEASLAALATAERELAQAPSEALEALRARLLEEAAERLWYTVVQREAMGLTSHDALFETCRVPPLVRRRMGPRRRRHSLAGADQTRR
jgi:hypothetical protein